MPLYVPTPIADISAAVWAHLPARKLTSLNDPTDIIKYVAKGTGSEIPANTSLYDVLALIAAGIGGIPLTPELEADALVRYINLLAAVGAIPVTPELEADALVRFNALVASIGSIPLTPELEADALVRYTAIKTNILDVYEIEKSFGSSEAFADINVIVADQSLGAKNITVALPAGATVRAAIAIAIVHIMNDAATTQKISMKLNVVGTTVFNQSSIVGLGNADGASSVFTIVEDVSAVITTVGVKALEALVTLSDAHSTHFTTMYGLIIVYRMS